jgi:RNA polymerase sigma factor (sigma-70 family)
MSVATTDAAEERFRTIYEEHFDLLAGIAVNKFRVPDSEAETLAHEVFLTFLKKTDTIGDLRGWLVGAICHASRHYWRQNKRIMDAEPELDTEYADPMSRHIDEVMTAKIAANEALDSLAPRYQEILRLRYFAGMTVPEIAAHLGVKPKYAQKLVTKCLRRAEKFFEGPE